MYYLVEDSKNRDFAIIEHQNNEFFHYSWYSTISIASMLTNPQSIHIISIEDLLKDPNATADTLICQFEALEQLEADCPELFI